MQSVGSTPRISCSTMGSILHAGLSAVRSSIEESAISTVSFRGFQRNAEVSETSPQAHSYLALPFFFGPLRFHAKYQHDCWCHRHRPHLLMCNILPVQRNDIPSVAIQDLHLAPD